VAEQAADAAPQAPLLATLDLGYRHQEAPMVAAKAPGFQV
jgi:hypothetical protein